MARVVVGGSFACDEALARPLGALLAAVVGREAVDVDWLSYGSLSDGSQWVEAASGPDASSKSTIQSCQLADLVVVLVRVGDLEAAHPELQSVKSLENDSKPLESLPPGLESFVGDLEKYSKLSRERPPVVVICCPPPPELAERHEVLEQLVISRLKSTPSRVLELHPSYLALDLFRWHYPDADFYDAMADQREHAPFAQQMLNVLSLMVCRQVRRLLRSPAETKKCIVLDCDNTLWGGAVAEVGAQSIELSARFLSLQRFVLAQQREKGMLLCLSSKNVKEDVEDAFATRRKEMPIKLDEHIAVAKVNWEPKSSNIRAIAQELSLGLDSFVFIDDNPVECSEVATELPMVSVIHLPKTFTPRFLEPEWVFDSPLCRDNSELSSNAATTKEDLERTRFYQMNKDREQLQREASTHMAFLSSLGVRIEFEELSNVDGKDSSAQEETLMRVLQLHHRTNQFNTSTTFSKTIVRDKLNAYTTAVEKLVLCARVTDRFGHYGLVSSAVCRVSSNDGELVLLVDAFLLSCRALNRGVEHAMLRKLATIAQRSGARCLVFEWEPTARNQPALLLFSSLPSVRFVPVLKDTTAGSENPETCSGQWIIGVDAANSVTFLKMPGKSSQPTSQPALKQASIAYFFQSRLAALWRLICQRAMVPIFRFFLQLLRRFAPIQHAFGRIKSSNTKMKDDTPFREPGELEQFLSSSIKTPKQATESAPTKSAPEARIDQNELFKFRRKARHQTKLTLLHHLHDEIPAVVWSANRPHDSSDDSNTTTCDTASCDSRVGRNSSCSFRRCRNCCYRIQRLLHRVGDPNAHVTARESAMKVLSDDYEIDSNMVEHLLEEIARGPDQDSFCAAHRNKRRVR